VDAIAGPHTVGLGGEYATLKAAFDDINARTVTGDVTLTILASGTTETASAVLNAASYSGGPFTITITPEPGSAPTISGDVPGALIKLNGADHVVIDGNSSGPIAVTRNLSIVNTRSAANESAAVQLSSQGSNGCTDNVIQNCNLRCGVPQTTSQAIATWGVMIGGQSLFNSSNGVDNDRNLVANNSIEKCRYGVFMIGANGNNPDEGNAVIGNTIGPAVMDESRIGVGGIVLHHQNAARVERNEVRCIGELYQVMANGSARYGIALGFEGWVPGSQTSSVTDAIVDANRIHQIVNENRGPAAGIVLAGNGLPSNNLVANNMVHDVRANGQGGAHAVGIGIADGNGDRVVDNTVALSGDMDPVGSTASESAVAIRIARNTPQNLTLKGNIFYMDATSNTPTLKHFGIVVPTLFDWGTGGSDYNDFYPKAGNAQAVLGGRGTTVPYAEVATLADWRAQFTPRQDGASIAADPGFVATNDLHVSTTGQTTSPVANVGVPISGVATDFDGEAGNRATTPDIGADEFTTYTLTTHVVGSGSVAKLPDYPSYNPGLLVQLTATPAANWTFSHWSGDAGGNANPLQVLMDASKDITATFQQSAAAPDAELSIPLTNYLRTSSPNPFQARTLILYGLAERAAVRLQIFDVQGRRVRDLVNGIEDAGHQRVEWDGSDDQGTGLPSGFYVVCMRTKSNVLSHSVRLLR
jgi:hypothetical protein